MARVTVEDCLENVKNRFELVMLASKRARQLMRGSAEPKVAWENDKPTVVALREIAMGYTDFTDAHHADPMHHASATLELHPSIDMSLDIDTETATEITTTETEIDTETPKTDDTATTEEDPSAHETSPSGNPETE